MVLARVPSISAHAMLGGEALAVRLLTVLGNRTVTIILVSVTTASILQGVSTALKVGWVKLVRNHVSMGIKIHPTAATAIALMVILVSAATQNVPPMVP